jgi:CRP-like cAMP-binding protein
MKGTDQWIVFPANERKALERQPLDSRTNRNALHLGIIFQLKQLRQDARKQGHTLSSSRRRSKGRFIFAAVGIISLFILALYILGIVLDQPKDTLIQAYQDVLTLPLAFWATLHILAVMEWLILRSSFEKGSPILEWRNGSLRVNRVAWELGSFVIPAILVLALLGTILAWSGMMALSGSVICSGIFLGSWFYLVLAISPFSPGPATQIYSRLFGSESIIQIQDQFLLGLWSGGSSSLGGKIAPSSFVAAFSMIAWVILVALSFGWIADHLARIPELQLLIVQLICNILGFGFCLWTIVNFISFLIHHTLLREAKSAQSFSPTSLELSAWQRSCALLQHVPEIANLPWQWRWFPTGTMLMRRGDESREFHWLAFGEAVFIQSESAKQPQNFIPIHGGSGFGEYEFFHGGPRKTDVLLRTRSVITTLHYDAIASIATPDIEERIHAVSLASQIMDQSQMFRSMPSYAKEEWMCHAKICKVQNGTSIIKSGSLDTWMGLLVKGGMIVIERSGKEVSELLPGDVFGEMALWSKGPRSANVTAHGEVLFLRWEDDWWAAQVKINGLEDYINELVAKRYMS